MAQARRCARPPLSLELTIPDDERFVETARALSVRVAEFVGYEGPEAAAIGAAVVEALVIPKSRMKKVPSRRSPRWSPAGPSRPTGAWRCTSRCAAAG